MMRILHGFGDRFSPSPPWTDSRLTGMVDFPGLHVSPGSRRGIIPDEMAYQFAEALTRVEPLPPDPRGEGARARGDRLSKPRKLRPEKSAE